MDNKESTRSGTLDSSKPGGGLDKAKRSLKAADHMLYVTHSIIRESKILLKVLQEIGKSANILIEFVLENEQKAGRLRLCSDEKTDLESFSKSAGLYGISSQQMNELKQLLDALDLHKKSPMEFSRKEKFVIMSEEFQTDILNVERLKKHLALVKDMLKRVEETTPKQGF